MIEISKLSSLITWVVYFIYCFGLIPQILLNYRLKSANGMSDLMLFGYLTGYLAQFYYVFYGNFPMSYKVMIPISIFFVSILVFQRFYYHLPNVSRTLKFTYFGIFSFVLLFTPFFINYKPDIALISGWICTGIWFVYQLPQVIKIQKTKSFRGVSFAFLSLAATAVFLEFISALILDLPIQTIVSNVRAMVVYAVFALQFYWYGKA